MANTQGMATSFKTDVWNGLHAFGASVIRAATTKDVFMAALYAATATISAATTAYSATGELAATGNYAAGGVVVPNTVAPSSTGTTAFWTPSGALVWANLTSSASFDCVLIYNSTAAGKNAVSVHTFGAQTITAATFTLNVPTNDSTNGLLRNA